MDPSQYSSVSAYELLRAAAMGQVGVDHAFLHALLDKPRRTLPGIVRFARDKMQADSSQAKPHFEERVDLEEDLISIFRYLLAPEGLEFLLERVRREPEDIPEALVEALVEIGAPALEPLLRLYSELPPSKRPEVAFALAALPVRDSRVVSLLVDRMETDPDDAVLCLALHGDPSAVPALETLLAQTGSHDDPGHSLRLEIQQAIDSLRRGPRAPLPIDDFDIWAHYPEKAPPCFEVLTEEECLELLDSTVPEHRAQAASTFVLEELPENVCDKLFEKALHDPEAGVRAACWEALAGVLDNTRIRNAMLRRLGDSHAPKEERCGALLGLASRVSDARVNDVLMAFYRDPKTRPCALEAMWRSLDPQYASYMKKHLADEDLEVRRQAVLGVGYLGVEEAARDLRRLFHHADLRHDALYAYAMGAPAEATPEGMRELFTAIHELAGLDIDEAVAVQSALDDRLALAGQEPVFALEHAHT
jgi:HEAT repeat protein